VSFPRQCCCARRSIFADVLCPYYFSIFSSVDRNTGKKKGVLHFFCSMVVAQPHDCNIGQTGGCRQPCAEFGHEYIERETKCLCCDCPAFFISFGGYLSVSRTGSCFEYDELLYICKEVVSQ
jgi:hypothetical protein